MMKLDIDADNTDLLIKQIAPGLIERFNSQAICLHDVSRLRRKNRYELPIEKDRYLREIKEAKWCGPYYIEKYRYSSCDHYQQLTKASLRLYAIDPTAENKYSVYLELFYSSDGKMFNEITLSFIEILGEVAIADKVEFCMQN